MSHTEPTITTLSAADAQRQLKDLLRRVAEGTTYAVIEEDGTALAALISIDDLRRLQRDKDFEALESFSEGFEDVPITELEQKVASSLREVRAERRQNRAQIPSNS